MNNICLTLFFFSCLSFFFYIQIHDDLEKEAEYSGSGFGPDDEDSQQNTHNKPPHHKPSKPTNRIDKQSSQEKPTHKSDTDDDDLDGSGDHTDTDTDDEDLTHKTPESIDGGEDDLSENSGILPQKPDDYDNNSNKETDEDEDMFTEVTKEIIPSKQKYFQFFLYTHKNKCDARVQNRIDTNYLITFFILNFSYCLHVSFEIIPFFKFSVFFFFSNNFCFNVITGLFCTTTFILLLLC